MTSRCVFWVAIPLFLLLLLLQIEPAKAWLPSGISKFRQRIVNRRRRRRATATQKNATTNSEGGGEGEGAGVDVVVAPSEEKDAQDEEEEETERLLLSLLPWWEDSWSEAFINSFPLSPATSYLSSLVTTNGTTSTDGQEGAEVDADEDELAYLEKPNCNPSAKVLHFCFLLHGHRGFSTDLSYLQRMMQHHAELEKKQQLQHQQGEESGDSNSSDQCAQDIHDMIVHCAVCNEGKTMDGVINGGERLVQEILQVIRTELKQRKEMAKKHQQQKQKQINGSNNTEEEEDDMIQDITISIVGNSLGGVYGRYAIARLAQKAEENDENHPELSSPPLSSSPQQQSDSSSSSGGGCVLLDGKYKLHFNIFCSTASPHLGISKHTYVPVPRSVEVTAAHVLGETGRDLFRLNDLMKTMATCPTFLEPLRKFRKRVAYANAFATDFPVPASTAAFLSSQSTYPHHFAEEEDNNGNDTKEQEGEDDDARRHIVATLHTRPGAPAAALKSPLQPTSKESKPLSANNLPTTPEQEAIVDDLVQMSYSLDSLGWKKVFVDVRKEIPIRVAIPRSAYKNIRKSLRKSLILSAKLSPSRLRKSLSEVVANTTQSTNTTNESNSDNDTKDAVVDGSDIEYSDSDDSDNDSVSSNDDNGSSTNNKNRRRRRRKRRPTTIHRLRQKGVVESRDVASVVSTPADMRLSFPLGHNLMVALDRGEGISSGFYKGGRPVMDTLAKELVHDIFDWNFQEEEQEKTAAKEESVLDRK